MILKTLDRIFENIWSRKLAFFGVFMVVVTLTYAFLVIIDFIPEAPSEDTDATALVSEDVEEVADFEPAQRFGEDATPDKIIFDTLDKEVAILNPNTTAVAALDTALLSGVVRHPDSATLLSNGTMFFFGHSSYLPVVRNKNYQAFNGIQDMRWGDTIRVQSADFEYVYRVDRVYEAKASTATVELVEGTPRLVLSTCNTFGAKEDRHIVEATLVDSYPL